MTTFLQVKNNAVGTLFAAINSTALTMAVQSGEGAKYPSTPFHITIGPANLPGEIIRVDSVIADTFVTIVRGQEGTVATSHSAGDAVELRVTAQSITDLNTAVDTLETDSHPKTDASPHHAETHPLDDPVHTGSLADSQHPVIASGDKHPEYQTPAEHLAVGDSPPHHIAATATDGKHIITAQIIAGVAAALAQQGHIALANHLGGTADLPQVISHAAIGEGNLHPEYLQEILHFNPLLPGHHVPVTAGAAIGVSGSQQVFHAVESGNGDLHPGYQNESEANPDGSYGKGYAEDIIASGSFPDGFTAEE